MGLRNVGVAALILAASGCVSGPDMSQYVVDGVQYGEVKPWRGRWWNYYERGRSFQDGGFYEEAERDFRTALSQRTKDQRWARTYGLHFVSEYFPNREIGITLFRQNRFEEAIQFLENSGGDTFTARMAYFLDESRTALVIAQNSDRESPSIELLSPDPSAVIASLDTTISFAVRDDTFVRYITVNGEEFPVQVSGQEILGTHTIQLDPGENIVTIAATDVTGKTTVMDIALATDHDGPAVSFDGPVTLPGTVRGVAYDPAGVAFVEIAGREANLSQTSDGLTAFEITLSRADMNEPIYYRTEDAMGNFTFSRLPVETIVVSELHGDIILASTMNRVRVAENVDAIMMNGEVMAFTLIAQAGAEEATIEFADPEEGSRFNVAEVYVQLKVASVAPIQSLELNGIPLENLIPGRNEQVIGRAIPLREEGEHTLVATLQDTEGRTAESTRTIERTLSEIDSNLGKLNVAVLGNVWEDIGDDEQTERDREEFLTRFQQKLEERGRFQLLARDATEDILSEQELIAALGSAEARQSLGQIAGADIFIIGKVKRQADNLEVVAHIVNADNSVIMGYPDVAGRVTSAEDLLKLADDLALRIEQKFPRVEGIVAELRPNDRLVSTLSAADRIFRHMQCIVYHKQETLHPVTGAVLGSTTEIRAEGTIDEIQAQLSTLILQPDSISSPVEVLDFVRTK